MYLRSLQQHQQLLNFYMPCTVYNPTIPIFLILNAAVIQNILPSNLNLFIGLLCSIGGTLPIQCGVPTRMSSVMWLSNK